ncbi:alpha/beta hydrolase family protein [Alicyclobacillus sendaiensis]|uniref:Alpha/beta fold hydrolase n=1 Tax=Alicyclobacillus sendaiensis PA2 TaxID=3029425 RepID=A0ABT6XYD3_ALISE|nr:alpha/beta fold hydrolase [Alicyclobacillus sendaiensis]MDI9260094.1 alpha/beta fold hydrolase [Alicyclobacillus sendaiensis PA2]
MVEEDVIVGSETEHPLPGSLSLPDGEAHNLPAALLVHGSGPNDRDERIGNNAPFRDLAEGLAARGIAVLRYDKRTYVYRHQMRRLPYVTVWEETIEDALRAVALLRQHPRIAPNRVFLIGHSLGGMLAPRIDAEGGDFAGLVIMAGSPRKLEEILIDQNLAFLRRLRNRFVKRIAERQIAKLTAECSRLHELSDEEAKATKLLGRRISAYYLKEMGDHPSGRYLRDWTKPVLILQGDKDFHVSVDSDFNGYRRLLGQRPNATFKLYPNLNHLFMPSVYGDIRKAKEEYRVPQHVHPQVIEDIADWIHSICAEADAGHRP